LGVGVTVELAVVSPGPNADLIVEPKVLVAVAENGELVAGTLAKALDPEKAPNPLPTVPPDPNAEKPPPEETAVVLAVLAVVAAAGVAVAVGETPPGVLLALAAGDDPNADCPKAGVFAPKTEPDEPNGLDVAGAPNAGPLPNGLAPVEGLPSVDALLEATAPKADPAAATAAVPNPANPPVVSGAEVAGVDAGVETADDGGADAAPNALLPNAGAAEPNEVPEPNGLAAAVPLFAGADEPNEAKPPPPLP
jgi:hypothetical protein